MTTDDWIPMCRIDVSPHVKEFTMTPAQPLPELLPCPHCGEPDAFIHKRDCEDGSTEELWAYSVDCRECQARTGPGHSLAEAIAAWNRRPAAPCVVLPIKPDFGTSTLGGTMSRVYDEWSEKWKQALATAGVAFKEAP